MIRSMVLYAASCDLCSADEEDDDVGTVVHATAEQALKSALANGYVVHRRKLACTSCVEELAAGEHDFVGPKSGLPECRICKGIPNGHPNVEAVGQQLFPGTEQPQ